MTCLWAQHRDEVTTGLILAWVAPVFTVSVFATTAPSTPTLLHFTKHFRWQLSHYASTHTIHKTIFNALYPDTSPRILRSFNSRKLYIGRSVSVFSTLHIHLVHFIGEVFLLWTLHTPKLLLNLLDTHIFCHFNFVPRLFVPLSPHPGHSAQTP